MALSRGAGLLRAFLLFTATAFAQSGNISGIVTDSSRQGLLVGASVTVEGQALSATTDDSGRYLLLNIPAGGAKVSVAYLGFATAQQNVAVPAGATIALDFVLSPEVVNTSVTVTSEAASVGQERALNDQKNSINLINLVASDQIGAFPDPNAAEATQRIPGIVVQRDQGEGRYILIRGTEPRLSATTINGVRIGTTENTSRQIPLDTIPADLLGAIEVTKVLTPDIEADSIGGRANLITKRAPARPHVALTIGSGFNTLVKDDIKDYNGTYGQRLFHDKLGFIGSANFYQNNRGSQDLEPSYTAGNLAALDFRDYVLTRTRQGGTWDVDYRLKPGSEVYFRGIRTEYEDSELRNRFRDLVTNGRLERLLRDRYHDSNQLALMTGGSHTLPKSWLITWRASYSNARLDTPYRLESTFRQTGVTFAPNVSAASIDPQNIQANPQNQNLNNFNFIQNAIQNDRGVERNLAGAFDITAPVRLKSRTNLVKFGLGVRDANRTRDVASATQTPRSGTTLRLLDNTDADYSPADAFLGGKYSEFGNAFPDVDKMRDLSRGSTLNTVWAATGDSGSYRAKERVTGGYIMDEIYLGEKTVLLPGIRFEATTVNYGAPQYTLGAGGAVVGRTFANGERTYLNVLPGIHLRHELFNNTPLRLSFSRTLARPNYNDLAPYTLQDNTALTISRGNPNLNVTTSNNFDASLEHYFKSVGIASVGFFAKHLNNYIFTTTTQQSDLYRVTQPVNGDSANIYGTELALVRKLDFLPSFLAGISTLANYTHVTSNATMPRGKSVLPGQASNMGNASLAYERHGFSTRLSFNYQGTYLFAVGNTAAEDTWLDNRLEIDWSASQQLGKHARVFIDMINLGNNPYRVYTLNNPSRPIQEERYKTWAILGLKLEF